MPSSKIGIIGLGLIGGSLARAFRLFSPECVLTAFDADPTAADAALREGVIDYKRERIDEGFSGQDYIFLCAPVAANAGYLPQIKAFLGPETILTDVGSVKTHIHETIVREGLSRSFIGGHPMTGSEKTGFSNSKALIFENAYYIMTPEPETPPDMIERYKKLIESIHGIPIVMDCERHDKVTAIISHLPHIIASGLVNYVEASDDNDLYARRLAAGGFRDITRIASSSPDMWQQICLTNTDWIIRVLRGYEESLDGVIELLSNKDSKALYDFFENAREYRNSIPVKNVGPIERSYVLYCDLIDEAGTIATIATILATAGISIKNIGIVHNREFEEGVLRIEFYEQAPLDKAVTLLNRHHYTVYIR